MKKLLLAALLGSVLAIPAAAQQPNIIVVMSDDLNADVCGLGMTRVCAAMATGRNYTRAYTTHSVCAPARVSFLTGQTTDQHGVQGDGGKIADRTNLLPEQLREAGYRTGIFGKDPQGVPFKMNRIGFDDFAVYYAHQNDTGGGDRYFDPVFETPTGTVQKQGYAPEVIGEECTKFVESATQPFFVWCTDIAPHAPNTPKPEHVGKCNNLPFPVANRPSFNETDLSDKPNWFDPPALDLGKQSKQAKKWRTTCETMMETDKWVQNLIQKAGPNTVVVFMSDHGLQFGEHRLTGKNVAYEESIRIPLTVWGGNFVPGNDARLVSTTDLVATIFALASATPGRPMDPTARDLRGEPRTSVSGTAEWGQDEVQPGPSGLTRWIVEPGWRYFSHQPDGGEEMYNMDVDPWQVDSLAMVPPRKKRQMRYRKTVHQPKRR